jgi:hypothetical protein
VRRKDGDAVLIVPGERSQLPVPRRQNAGGHLMRIRPLHRKKSAHPPRLPRLGIAVLVAVCAVALTPIAGEGLLESGMQFPKLPPEINHIPDANEQMKMNEQQAKSKNFEAINAERKRQLSEESAMLLKLATDLKSEVDKTSKDTLSLNVIRKAGDIEKLAHDVKEKMKLSIGSS